MLILLLILRNVHQNLGHCGSHRAHTTFKGRKRFWIININSAVRKTIGKYSYCLHYKGIVVGGKWLTLQRQESFLIFHNLATQGWISLGPDEVRRDRSTWSFTGQGCMHLCSATFYQWERMSGRFNISQGPDLLRCPMRSVKFCVHGDILHAWFLAIKG